MALQRRAADTWWRLQMSLITFGSCCQTFGCSCTSKPLKQIRSWLRWWGFQVNRQASKKERKRRWLLREQRQKSCRSLKGSTLLLIHADPSNAPRWDLYVPLLHHLHPPAEGLECWAALPSSSSSSSCRRSLSCLCAGKELEWNFSLALGKILPWIRKNIKNKNLSEPRLCSIWYLCVIQIILILNNLAKTNNSRF